MIKQFIFAKLAEKFFRKAIQGDKRGIMKYFKIAIVVISVIIVLIIIGIILFIQFLYGLFTHIGTQVDSVRNVNEIKIEESIKKAKEMAPEEVTTMVEQVKTKIVLHDSLLQEARSVILKGAETMERFEKFIP